MNKDKIAIIGCGNLGLSIANGLLNTVDPQQLIATRRHIENLQELQEKGVEVTSDNIKAVQEANIIILALKPYNIAKIVDEIQSNLRQDQIVISLATGVSLADLREIIPVEMPIFRAMPNTAADINESMTCISTQSSNKKAQDKVRAIFNTIGESVFIDDNLMNAATVIDACGIAYVLRFMRAMIQGGIQIGFDAKTATDIVTQTVKGASELLIQNHTHPEEEIDKVTTPKGCTIVGLNEMEHNGFSSALIKGIVASYNEIGE